MAQYTYIVSIVNICTKTQRPRIQADLQDNLYTIRSTRDVMSISILCDYNQLVLYNFQDN